jgi:DNA invertase Pin-like site-specific DNA recombinase
MREIGFTSLHERLDTTAHGGRLVLHVFAALADIIRAARDMLPNPDRSPTG